MAVGTQSTTITPDHREQLDLRDMGASIPGESARVGVTIAGDVCERATIILEHTHTWEIDVALGTGEVEAVYDDQWTMPKPERAPDWLEAVLAHYGVDEVTI